MSPYKDPERRREAGREHYRQNKDRYRDTQRRLRAQPGYRDEEMRKRREAAAAERALRPPKPPPKPPPPRRPRKERAPKQERVQKPTKSVEPRYSKPKRTRKLTRDEIAEQQRIQELIDAQRRMKEAALRRFGGAA